MSVRRILWQIHRWLGLAVGLLFFVVAATGVVLIWSQELNLRGHHALPAGATTEVSPALPSAIADFVDAHPGSQLGAVLLPRGTGTPRAWQVFLRPEAGGARIVGEFDPARAALLATHDSGGSWQRWLEDLHYKFLLGQPGKYLCLLVALAFVLLPLTGLCVHRIGWRELFHGRPGRTARSRMAWCHRWLGAWTVILTVLWGVTGFIYLLLLLPGRPHSIRTETTRADSAAIRRIHDLPALLSAARTALPGGEIVSLRIVSERKGNPLLTVRTLHRDRWFWEKIAAVTLDARSGHVRNLRAPGSGTPREQLPVVLAALHFGSQGGRLQQVVWTLGGIVLCVLPMSGYALRFWRPKPAPPPPCNEAATAPRLSAA